MFQPLNFDSFFDCLYIDLPGHGENKNLDFRKIEDMAQAITIVLNTLHWEDFFIVGHSMGGYVGLEIMPHFPKAQLVLFHSNFWEDEPSKKLDRERVAKIAETSAPLFIKETMPNLFLPAFRDSEFVQKSILQALTMSGSSIALASIAMKNRRDFSNWVMEHQERVYFVQGELDPVVPLQKSLEKCASIAHFFVIENCGHMGHLENPEMIISLLSEIIG